LNKSGNTTNHQVEQIRKHCKPPHELSPDEGVPGSGCLILVNLQSTEYRLYWQYGICTAEGKLEEIIFSVVEPYLDLWHHVYRGKYYNSVEIAEKLLLRK
jgi:hypothetical protein